MKSKLYSISELINENISLKKKLNKIEIQHIKKTISLLELIYSNQIRSLDLSKIITGLQQELENIK